MSLGRGDTDMEHRHGAQTWSTDMEHMTGCPSVCTGFMSDDGAYNQISLTGYAYPEVYRTAIAIFLL